MEITSKACIATDGSNSQIMPASLRMQVTFHKDPSFGDLTLRKKRPTPPCTLACTSLQSSALNIILAFCPNKLACGIPQCVDEFSDT
eukprot:CAMPEP_0184366186 /NCGR_PEP_ID=MMETSP1089-20130417/152521_1 /TAXON_ID=38269 ORGANISM="Gloeochaete wittrockiana, Strain SAG46.84" /NCGR_SAMPLE_ID=MMETSP1089 /ASSEMBLY_ACC=CAM_ASM_000445 /LENGTH=86 /DNA_ID=CAMNT_0026707679 /DNA_START=32 /DNA_END=292 /DNA_ORIENTATION=-